MDDFFDEQELPSIVNELVTELLEDYDANEVAAILMVNAFMIYGQIIPKEEYKEFMSDIFKNSEQFSEPKYRVLH